MRSRRTAWSVLPAAAVLASLALAGCSGHGGATTASATAKPIGTPVDTACDQLVPSSALDIFGKTFTLDREASAHPADGTPAATIAGQRGRVCVWRSTTGHDEITVAVADLPEDALTNLKNSLYKRSNQVPTYTVEGYFTMQGAIGRADSFPDPYWVNAESTLFTEPGAAQPLLDAARKALTGATGGSATG